MPKLINKLLIDTCPNCGINSPNLYKQGEGAGHDLINQIVMRWKVYICNACGFAVLAYAATPEGEVIDFHPKSKNVDDSIPEKPRNYLKQALESLHAPSGAVMLTASSVDAMLKEIGYKKGSLYARIDKAVEDHKITEEMAAWAHEIRLDANDERHADEDASLPDASDAKKCVDFALALSEFLFVLPSRVERGRSQ